MSSSVFEAKKKAVDKKIDGGGIGDNSKDVEKTLLKTQENLKEENRKITHLTLGIRGDIFEGKLS